MDETLSDRKISAAKPPSAPHEPENSLRNDTYLKLPGFIHTCHKHKHSEESGVRFIYAINISTGGIKTEKNVYYAAVLSISGIWFVIFSPSNKQTSNCWSEVEKIIIKDGSSGLGLNDR